MIKRNNFFVVNRPNGLSKGGQKMNFDLTEEQLMVQKMVKDFAEQVIKPRAIEIDQEAKFPEDIFQEMGKLGFMGIPFPEKYGGSGGDTLSYILAVEEIAKVCGSTALSYAANVSLGASPLYYFGTEAQKEKYLTPIVTGDTLGAFGLTEPNAGSDAGGTQTTAIKENGEYIINGEKSFITNASFSNTIIVTAVTGKDDRDRNIISSIIVPTDTEGVTITNNYDKMGVRGSDTAEVVL